MEDASSDYFFSGKIWLKMGGTRQSTQFAWCHGRTTDLKRAGFDRSWVLLSTLQCILAAGILRYWNARPGWEN
jgi:hypothetical protein